VRSSTGAPVAPQRKGSPERVWPSRVAGLKNVKAIAVCPLPSTLSAKAFDSLIRACACESVFTPTTTRGGAKEAWVTQFTVAAATASSLPFAVRT